MMQQDLKRAVVHMDLDAFFVSVERMRDRRLEGKPVIIGGRGNRGVVASCSYEARRFGVHSAMPMAQARRLCPEAIIVGGDMELYSQQSAKVTDIISDRSPLFEKASIDEFYIDLSGMDRFFGAYKWASELRHAVMQETGLPVSFGLAINKLVAKMATNEIKPNGQMHIVRGTELDFLAPLHVSKIPMVGEATSRILHGMGVQTVQDLREVPRHQLERVFGRSGSSLWQRARGIDNSPVMPYGERKSISVERTFGSDTFDTRSLLSILCGMTEKIGFRLRREEKLTACVAVKVRYADFETVSCQHRVPYTSNDSQLAVVVQQLFNKLYDGRKPVRLVGVRFSHLVHGGHQTHLFEDTETQVKLYQAIDKVKYKYGTGAVTRANAVQVGNAVSSFSWRE